MNVPAAAFFFWKLALHLYFLELFLSVRCYAWTFFRNKCPSLLQFPGKDLLKVTTDSSLINNNPLSNGKRYKVSFNWGVKKIVDKKAQANKCPSLLQFLGKDLPNVTTDSSLLNNNSLSMEKGTKLVSIGM